MKAEHATRWYYACAIRERCDHAPGGMRARLVSDTSQTIDFIEVSREGGGHVCTIRAGVPRLMLEDARLISAAPDLLEALQGLVGCEYGPDKRDGDLFSQEAHDKARAAIARATGGKVR